MARRRRVSFPVLTEADFFSKAFPLVGGNVKRLARLKREIVKEVLDRIYKEDYVSTIIDGDGGIDPDVQDYWDEHGKNEVRKAARLAIDLWEKRR